MLGDLARAALIAGAPMGEDSGLVAMGKRLSCLKLI
jgi:hypothetical protein